MAYVGNTAQLCQDIVDGELTRVQDWLSQDSADPNTRDYMGRTPLQLAVMSSSPEIVQCLVNHGARLITRLVDGRNTTPHLAAKRGGKAGIEIVKILMKKSATNESEEGEKQFRKRNGDLPHSGTSPINEHEYQDVQDLDIDIFHDVPDKEGRESVGPKFFVKVKKDEEQNTQDGIGPEVNKGDPGFYNVNAVAWDVPGSPMHFAILGGHEDIVKLLCEVSFSRLSFTL